LLKVKEFSSFFKYKEDATSKAIVYNITLVYVKNSYDAIKHIICRFGVKIVILRDWLIIAQNGF